MQRLCQAAPHSGSPDPKHTQATSWATSAYEQLVLLQLLGSLWILTWSFLVFLSLGSQQAPGLVLLLSSSSGPQRVLGLNWSQPLHAAL